MPSEVELVTAPFSFRPTASLLGKGGVKGFCCAGALINLAPMIPSSAVLCFFDSKPLRLLLLLLQFWTSDSKALAGFPELRLFSVELAECRRGGWAADGAKSSFTRLRFSRAFFRFSSIRRRCSSVKPDIFPVPVASLRRYGRRMTC